MGENKQDDECPTIKLIIVGSGDVGQSVFLMRFLPTRDQKTNSEHKPRRCRQAHIHQTRPTRKKPTKRNGYR